jgi:hypothetical protein
MTLSWIVFYNHRLTELWWDTKWEAAEWEAAEEATQFLINLIRPSAPEF